MISSSLFIFVIKLEIPVVLSFLNFTSSVGRRKSQSSKTVLYPTEAIEAARLKEIKLLPSCGCEDVISITFDFSDLSLRNKELLRFLNDSEIADLGDSATTASYFFGLLYIIPKTERSSKSSISWILHILSFNKSLIIKNIVGINNPRNSAIM